ncbi:MAG: N-acetylneuraminate synthase [Bacteroidetes bacterium 4484_276]|nr:MAG: N-acetylneuraminate synthase [Bacteroidetes bacterium 4484_276]
MGKTIIIAEAGVNHNGSIELAKTMIDQAKNAGVDYIKFQTFKAEKLVSVHAAKADYQKTNTNSDETQFEMIKKLELDIDAHKGLIQYCNAKGIKFISTPFDLDSIDLLFDLGVELFKIGSGEITNYPYLKKIAQKGLPVILSTGMSNLSETEGALDTLLTNGLNRDQVTLLHANTEYPTPFDDVNLNAMLTLKEAFKVNVGYSDHTPGIEVPVAAVAMGATIIEKHFTLDKTMEGPDHKASLEPLELKDMVKSIRNIEKVMGDGLKLPSISEKKNIPIARKSIVASCKILTGEVFSEENITTKRPGTGISPMRWNEVLGRVAQREFKPDDLIEI